MGQSEEQGKREVGGGAPLNIRDVKGSCSFIIDCYDQKEIEKILENKTYTIIYENKNFGCEFEFETKDMLNIEHNLIINNPVIKRCWTK